jgi:AmiR/NasT family two-component response regulator
MKEAAAFSFIQQTAMAGRLTMRSVAESVLKGETVPNS